MRLDLIRCFDDFEIGQEGETGRRTIGEPEISHYAWLSGDFSNIHVDRVFADNELYGTRIAHEPLATSIALGLVSMSVPQIVGQGIPGAFLYSYEVNCRDAVKLGDTIKIDWRVSEKTSDPDQDGFGLVTTAWRMTNQEGKSPYDGNITAKVRMKSAGDMKIQFRSASPWKYEDWTPDPDKIYYLEDFMAGQGMEYGARTITEADIHDHCCLTGDYNPLYLDAEFAKKSIFGERIVPGALVLNIVRGLGVRKGPMGNIKHPVGVFRGPVNDKIFLLTPAKVGDTIRCRWKIEATRPSKSKPEIGLLTTAYQALNQKDEVLVEAYLMLIRGRNNAK